MEIDFRELMALIVKHWRIIMTFMLAGVLTVSCWWLFGNMEAERINAENEEITKNHTISKIYSYDNYYYIGFSDELIFNKDSVRFKQLINAYLITAAKDNDLYRYIVEHVSEDDPITVDTAGSVINLSVSEDGYTLILSVKATNDSALCSTRAKIAEQYIEKTYEYLNKNVAEHTLTHISSGVYIESYTQPTLIPYTEGSYTPSTLWAVGIILGAGIIAFFIVLAGRAIDPKAWNEAQVREKSGLKSFGSYSEKKLACRDRLTDRILGVKPQILTGEEQMNCIAENLKTYISQQNKDTASIKTLCLVGVASDRCEEFCKRLGELCENEVNLPCITSVCANEQSINKIANSDGAILIVKRDITSFHEIKLFADEIHNLEKPVCGFILAGCSHRRNKD